MSQDIYIIDNNNNLILELKQIFKDDYSFRFKYTEPKNIELLFKNIPELIIINEDNIDIDTKIICTQIRENKDNSITPILVLSSNDDKDHKLDIIKNSVEYFVEKSMGQEYLKYTIKNVARLLSVNRTVSPLTGLPGNVKIQSELKKRLLKKEPFSVLYLDLDNFKSYNDVYGFLKGDEIIKLTARIITKHVNRALEDAETFVGHIGGDDFIAILDGSVDFEKVSQNIIAEFDLEVKKYFTEEDLHKGFLEVQNRKGIIEEFPLTAISIGIVVCDQNRFANILEIGEVGAQVKHLAKATIGSCYAINRRENNE